VPVAVALLAGACDLPASAPRARLWTLFDLDRLARGAANAEPGPSLAANAGVPGGIPLSHFLTETDAGPQLTLSTTFTDDYRSAYFTTELWSGFDEVWVQPAYLPATVGADGAVTPVDGATPIFSVGPASAFYSPYWQIIYFEVAAGTAPDTFTASRQVIDSGATLIPGAGRLMTLAPDTTALPPADQGPPSARPPRQQGWLDGQPISFFQLGDNVHWGSDRVVEENPLFVFLKRDASGQLQKLDVPSVSGPGPIGHAGPTPRAANGDPLYGALWRVYTVELPPGAGPNLMSDPSDVVYGRVALDASCLADPANLVSKTEGSACTWLDAESVIEANIDAQLIRRTGLLITCPFVGYQDRPVNL
jgi:hypothetical protein